MSSTPEGEAPRISKARNDRTYMRLMELTQFVLDRVSKDAMEVDNSGFRSAVRVRLLHATMRSRLLARIRGQMSKLSDPPYRENRDGVPLSQEDIPRTLASFSGAPLLNVMNIGIMPSLQECKDYTALWEVIGYYVGIDTEILNAHVSSWHQCSRLTACSIVNIFAGESVPPPAVHFPTNKADVPKYLQIQNQNSATTSTKGTKPDVHTTPATLPVPYSVVNVGPLHSPSRTKQRQRDDSWLKRSRDCSPYLEPLCPGNCICTPASQSSTFHRHSRNTTVRAGTQSVEIHYRGVRRWGFMNFSVITRQSFERGEVLGGGEFEPRDEKDEFGMGEGGWLRAIGIAIDWSMIIDEMALVLLTLAPMLVHFPVSTTSKAAQLEFLTLDNSLSIIQHQQHRRSRTPNPLIICSPISIEYSNS